MTTATPPSKSTLVRALRNTARTLPQTRFKLFGFRDKRTGAEIGRDQNSADDITDALRTYRDRGLLDEIEVSCACALGQLAIGLGEDPIKLTLDGQNGIYWPNDVKTAYNLDCPAPEEMYKDEKGRLSDYHPNATRATTIITHLNDQHGWTTEQIATWFKQKVEL